jgi:hypothetical protein
MCFSRKLVETEKEFVSMFQICLMALLPLPGFDIKSVPEEAQTQTQNDGFQVIASRHTPMARVQRAIAGLGPVTEPSEFWSAIANDPAFSEEHRGLCVLQLFKRHVHRGMTLEQLNRTLKGAPWLAQEDVCIWIVISGYVPVGNFTVARHHSARLFTLRSREGLGGGIWLVMDIDLETQASFGERQFFEALRAKKVDPKYKNMKINDICADPLPQPSPADK